MRQSLMQEVPERKQDRRGVAIFQSIPNTDSNPAKQSIAQPHLSQTHFFSTQSPEPRSPGVRSAVKQGLLTSSPLSARLPALRDVKTPLRARIKSGRAALDLQLGIALNMSSY